MFLPIEKQPSDSLRPEHSGISESDWLVLAQFWYPVARIDEVGDSPFKAKLLDVELVVYRSGETFGVAVDRCPHRQVRLSAGKVCDGKIVCPYHELEFDSAGRCTKVPVLGAGVKPPAYYKLLTFRVELRYGLIWTCLAPESNAKLPDFPDLAGWDASEIVQIATRFWPASAARQVENFADLGHLPLVHSKTLGGSANTRIIPGRIDHFDDSVVLTADYTETPFAGEPRVCQYTYRIVLPFAIDFTVTDSTGHDMKLFDIACPTSAYECRVFQFMKDTRDVDHNHRAIIEGLDAVNLEDMHILQNLASPALPLDGRHEIHLPVDNVSHAYRERLRGLGLGQTRRTSHAESPA